MTAVQLCVLGPLRAVRDGREIDLGPRPQRRLVTALLVQPGRGVSNETLADVVWGDAPPATARNIIHGYVSNLRRAFEPDRPARSEGTVLVSCPGGYLLNTSPTDVDSLVFEHLAQEGLREDTCRLGEALALWRGAPFADIADHPVAEAEAARLGELKLCVIEAWARAELTLGRHESLVPTLRSLTEQHPFHEPLWASLMIALYRAGRQGDALRAYEAVCASLRDELGIEPGEPLRSLHSQILTHDPAVRARMPGNIPVPPSSFIGRESQLDELREALPEARLLTLTGAGGVGKTRLGLRLAAAVRDDFRDGAWWVDLAPVSDGALLPGVVSSTLPGTASDDVVTKLRERRVLLLLDNCEHLVDACALLVSTVLRACPNVVVVATSRSPLRIDGEVAYRVPSLTLPERNEGPLVASEAVRLFCDRARAARAEFRLAADNEDAVASISRRLDGIPLAIELAAARTRVLSTNEIADGLADRFALLRGGSRAALPRHRTLEASVEWSYRLLGTHEQRMLRRLSVFAGSFDLAAVRAVCGDGELDSVSALVDQSLIGVEQHKTTTRYRLLETIKQYAHGTLAASGEEREARERHLDHYLALAERREAPTTTMIETLIARLEPDTDNLRAAMDYGLSSGRTEQALRVATGAAPLWLIRGNWSELLRWLVVAQDADAGEGVRTKALVAASSMAGYWDFRAMHALAEQAAALARRSGDERRLAQALANVAYGAGATGHPAVRAVVEEALAVCRAAKHDASLVVALSIATLLGDPDARRAMGDEAVEAGRRSGSAFALAFATYHRGRHVYLLGEGRPTEACADFDEVLSITREINEMAYLSATLGTYAFAEVLRGNFERARALGEEAVEASRSSGMRPAEANALQAQGYLGYATGDLVAARDRFERALELWTAVSNRGEEHNARLGLALVCMRSGDLDAARETLRALADARVDEHGRWLHGRALLGLAQVSRIAQDRNKATEHLSVALSILAEHEDRIGLVDALEAAALLSEGDRAARLRDAAAAIRLEVGYVRFPVDRAEHERALVSNPAKSTRRTLALDEAVAYAMQA